MTAEFETFDYPFMKNDASEITITKKEWDKLPIKAKYRGKKSLYILQIFEWWATPKYFWRACIVK